MSFCNTRWLFERNKAATFESLFDRVYKIREAYYKKDASYIDYFIEDICDSLKIKTNENLQLIIPYNRKRLKQFGEIYDLFFTIDHNDGSSGIGTIIGAKYHPNLQETEVLITENFLFSLKSHKKEITRILKHLIVTHEDTHRQQLAKANNHIPGYEPDPNKEEYYIQPAEISAYARQLAAELIDKGYSKEDVLKFINSGITQDEVDTRIWPFLKLRNKYPEMWRRFCREVYDYFFNDVDDEFEWMEIEKKHRDSQKRK